MRCTALMKAPWPPPTIPRRTRSLRFIGSAQAQHPTVRRIVRPRGSEIVERLLRQLDHVVADEGRALTRALLRRLDGTFPLQDRPTAKAVLRQLREDAAEIHLTVT